jgi:hypothetical protein
MLAPARPAQPLALTALLIATVAGCGDGGDPSPATVRVESPPDGQVVHEDSVEVRGRVRPAGARVLVAGDPATVSGGRWRALVALSEGANVIDVGAAAPGAATVWTTVRVSRQTLVRVPDLGGLERGEAVAELRELGLRAAVEEGSGLLDRLVPGAWGVCETSPAAGAELARGALVRLSVSKTC